MLAVVAETLHLWYDLLKQPSNISKTGLLCHGIKQGAKIGATLSIPCFLWDYLKKQKQSKNIEKQKISNFLACFLLGITSGSFSGACWGTLAIPVKIGQPYLSKLLKTIIKY